MASPITGLGAGIQRRSTTEQAAEAVRQAILSGRLLPGTPLREAALAAELGVSRSTLREAARTLESEGLVRYQMNRGIVVADITGADAADIYAARAAVELAAVDALTEHRDPAVYGNLADLVEQIERAFGRGDVAAVLDGDRLFHATLVAATGSLRLRRWAKDARVEIILSLLTPFAAFLLAQSLHCSGVVAVMVSALMLAYFGPVVIRARSRLLSFGFWDISTFMINGSLWVFVGVQIPGAIHGIYHVDGGLRRAVYLALAVTGVIIVTRIVWVEVSTLLGRAVDASLHRPNDNSRMGGWIRRFLRGWCAGSAG